MIELTNHIIKGEQDFCTCPRCKLDVVALTLNQTEPKYVVTKKGELYSRAEMLTSQSDTDITKEITKALEYVAKNPRH